MAIAKEELVRGGYAYFVTRGVSAGGAAVHERRTRVRVLEWNRGAAAVEFEDGKRRLKPFATLEPDDEFLEEYRVREAAKRARIARESHIIEATPPAPPPTLTYSLAEKLATPEADDEAPALETNAQRREREDALAQIEALKSPPAQPVPEPAPEPEPVREPAPEPEPEQPTSPPFDLQSSAGRTAAARWAIAQGEGNRPVQSVAWELGVHQNTLWNWMADVLAGREIVVQNAWGVHQTPEALPRPVPPPPPEPEPEPAPPPPPEPAPELPPAAEEVPQFDLRAVEGREAATRWALAHRDKNGSTLRLRAQLLGVTPAALHMWETRVSYGRRLEVRGRPPGSASKPPVQLDEAQRRELVDAVNSGQLTRREAAEMYSVSVATVTNILREMRDKQDATPEPANMPRKLYDYDTEQGRRELIESYLKYKNAGKNCDEFLQRLSITRSMFYVWLGRYRNDEPLLAEDKRKNRQKPKPAPKAEVKAKVKAEAETETKVESEPLPPVPVSRGGNTRGGFDPKLRYTAEEKAQFIAHVEALIARGVNAQDASRQAGISHTSFLQWKMDVANGIARDGRPVATVPMAEQKRIAKRILAGTLTTRAVEAQTHVRATTVAKWVRRLKEGYYDHVIDLPDGAAKKPAQQSLPDVAEAPAPPPKQPKPRPAPPPAPPPPEPEPEPAVTVMPRPLEPQRMFAAFALPADAGGANGDALLQLELQQLKSDNLKLRARVKQLLAMVADE